MRDEFTVEGRLAALEDALDALVDASSAGAPCIVEGDKDEAALRALGVPGPIVKAHTGENLFAFVEALSRTHREAILLVDWDARGGRLAKRLREACRANGIALDDAHRLAIAKATRGEVKTVESLDTYLQNLPGRAPARQDPARVRRLLREARERAERGKAERGR